MESSQATIGMMARMVFLKEFSYLSWVVLLSSRSDLLGRIEADRDREHALRLLFLAWMHWADPRFVTGMSEDPRAEELWHEIFHATSPPG